MCVIDFLGRRLVTSFIMESGEILLATMPKSPEQNQSSKNADLLDRSIRFYSYHLFSLFNVVYTVQ